MQDVVDTVGDVEIGHGYYGLGLCWASASAAAMQQ